MLADILLLSFLMACAILLPDVACADTQPSSGTPTPHYSCDFFSIQELEATFDLVVTAVHPEQQVDYCNLDITGDEVHGLSITVYDNIGPEIWALGNQTPEQAIRELGRAAYWSQFGPVVWTQGGQRLEITVFGKLSDESRARLLQLTSVALARLDARLLQQAGQSVREQVAALSADSPCALVPLDGLQEALAVHVRNIAPDSPNAVCRIEIYGRDVYGITIQVTQGMDERFWNLMKESPVSTADDSSASREDIPDLGKAAYGRFGKTGAEIYIYTGNRAVISFTVATGGALSEEHKRRLLAELRHAVERLQ